LTFQAIEATLYIQSERKMLTYDEFLELLDQYEHASHINWDQHPDVLLRALQERSALRYRLADAYADAIA